jgi:hypothetical protein
MRFPKMAKLKPAHHPGGRIRHTLKAGVTGNAVFGGPIEEYRYRLSLTWD